MGDSFDSGIRGPGSGVNSICLGSIHMVRGSVLPATTNFLNKSQAKGRQGWSVRPGDASALWDIPTVSPPKGSSAHVTHIMPSDNSGSVTEGAFTPQLGKPRLEAEGGAGVGELPHGQAGRGPQLSDPGPSHTMHPGSGGRWRPFQPVDKGRQSGPRGRVPLVSVCST